MSKKAKATKFKAEPVFLYLGLAILLLLAEQTELLTGGAGNICRACTVPMLFIAAGGWSHVSESKGTGEKALIIRNAKVFLGTYFWFSLINAAVIAVRVMKDGTEYRNNELRDMLYPTVTLYGYSVLWILPVMFVSLTLCQILRKSISFKYLCIMITCLLIMVAAVQKMGQISLINIVVDSGMTMGGAAARVAVFFIRTVYATFFILTGEVFVMVTGRVKNHRERLLIPGVPLIAAGTAVIVLWAGKFYWPTLYFTNIWALMAGVLMETFGLWCICVWIGRVGVINYFGENAMLIYLTFLDLGGMQLAGLAGKEIFDIMDNSFASKAALVVVLIATEFIWIKILRLPVLSFLTGNYDGVRESASRSVK